MGWGGVNNNGWPHVPVMCCCPVYAICPGAGAWLSIIRRIAVCVLQG